ncbi:cytochrome P450 [Mollisia scopiformis]|uniref:Cytochrome P450 n=1 Tax=Mollisia scopiformis TaxID=149040 RepID=A0A194WV36_MOLSC|nr:cytochrome P450 [Mollisia scopiformis]KUJ11447.1 cytochrome P450 [Mollisia scopiformis]
MFLVSVFLQSLGSTLLLTLVYSVWIYFTSPIKSIPGPFFAKFTNLWRFFDTYGGRPELTQQMLHEKYGNAVRLGPNIVSISDPKLLRTLYNTRGDFLKSKFYTLNDTKVGSQIIHNVFSTLSNEFHASAMRPIQKFYKMSSVLTHEPLVDDTIAAFCKRLDEEFVETGKACKMDEWLLFFAWDVIAQMTFSRPMGFMDQGKDYSGLLATADRALDYFATVGQMPSFDHWLAKNPIRPIGPPSFDLAAIYCAQQALERQESNEKREDKPDMLDGFLEVKKSNPEIMNNQVVIGALLVNVLAGSDTSAILLRSIIYYTLKNPKVYQKLREELDNADLVHPVTYAAASFLPYLDAVIKESMRIHPSVGLLLERVVPESCLTLSDGTVIPPGTIVGMNGWVIHQNKEIYGQDAACFKPERWLRDLGAGETEDDFQARLSLMKTTDLTFGAGNRICLGKNISILEVYKVISTFFLKYDMAFVDPAKEWHVQNSWFVRQSGIDIKIQRRKRQ